MKTNILVMSFLFFAAFSAFGSGSMELVNTQEIELDNTDAIKISYSSGRISLFTGNTDKLIINEYMNSDNNEYFAHISRSGNTLTINNGRKPFRPIIDNFRRRIEISIPQTYRNMIDIKSGNGRVESADTLSGSNITINSSNGSIAIHSITANTINIRAANGDTNIGSIRGEAIVESSNGRIVIDQLFGIVTAAASNGSIKCTVAEITGNISFTSSRGSVTLYLPHNLQFNFSSRISAGRLNTPFSDRLFIPVTDRDLRQGTINSNNDSDDIPTINIRTSSGSINVDWI